MRLFSNFLSKEAGQDFLFGITILLVIIVPLVFFQYLSENFDTIKLFFWLLGMGVFLMVFSKRPFARREIFLGFFKNSITRKILVIILVGLLVSASLSLIFSVNIINSLIGFNYRFANSYLFIVLWVSTLFFLILTLNKTKALLLLKLLVFNSLFISIFGILQSLQIAFYDSLAPGGFSRAPSFLGNPNFSSMFVGVVLPYALYFFIKADSLKTRIYYGLASFFSVWALVVFSSRGAWLAGIIALLVACIAVIYYKIEKKYLYTLIGAFIIGVIITSAFGEVNRPGTINKTIRFVETNLNQRLDIWNVALEESLKRPLTGIGFGNFQVLAEANRDTRMAAENGVFDDPHNLFLHLLATGGFLVFIFFFGLILYAIFLLLERLQKEKDLLLIVDILAIVSFLIAAAFTPVTVPLFFLLAIVLARSFVEVFTNNMPVLTQIGTKSGIVRQGFLGGGLLLILLSLVFLGSELALYLGNRYHALKKDNISAKYYLISRTLNPLSQPAYFASAAKSIDLEKPDYLVEKLIYKGIKIRPLEANTYIYASNLYFNWHIKTGNEEYFNQAEKMLLQAIKIDPFFSFRYSKLGMYYYKKDRLEKAREVLKTGLSLNQKDFSGWIMLAKVYQKEGKHDQLKFAFERAFLLEPDNPHVNFAWKMIKSQPIENQIPLDAIFQ